MKAFDQFFIPTIVPLVMVATSLLSPSGSAAAEVEWGYHGDIGPANWGSLDPAFATCDTGTSQSPIDIETQGKPGVNAVSFPRLDMTTLEVVHNGHTIEAEIHAFDGVLNLDGRDFTLLQFHFHTASEHFIDGAEFPMEMHMVHRAADGTLAVVGAMIEEGEEHEELAKLFDALPQHEGDSEAIEDFELDELLPDDLSVFRYSGSLTTPGCSEGVMWNVLAESIELSAEQIQAFRDIFSGTGFPDGNRRPVQLLNGHTVMLGPSGQCERSDTTLCLNDGRFAAEVAWRTFRGDTGVAKVANSGATDDSGLFYFFNPDNLEMLLKVLDNCEGMTNRFRVFAAATTNVEYTLRVTDTETGAFKEYFNPLGVAAPAITDTQAFYTCQK